MNKLRFVAGAVIALVCAAAGCSGGGAQVPLGAGAANAPRVDEAKAGNVTGKVTYEGPAMATSPIKLDSDPACVKERPDGLTIETVLVKDGGLENVFVYVKDGLGNYRFDPPATPVTLDQKGCNYTPHVFGAQTGQPVEITNSDPTMHNVHALGKVNQEFNFAQAFQGIKNTKTFTAPEVMIHFRCNVHGWMSAYGGIVAHPYYAVTANGGAFTLKNLPAGTYTIEAWHEKLGTQTQMVTLGEKETKPVNFRFKATNP